MTAFCWFAVFTAAPRGIDEGSVDEAFLRATPGADRVLVHTPARTRDPYLDDGPPPPLALQLYFPTVEALEAALAPGGHLAGLPARMGGAAATQQAMLVRPFPVPTPRPAGGSRCTYLVTYEGEAADTNAWLGYYLRGHPPIMARFPGIREIEIYSRLDWVGAVDWPRATAVQRNKVVFDDPDALTTALQSPVRHEMRADFHAFPPFTGGNTHHPMHTTSLL